MVKVTCKSCLYREKEKYYRKNTEKDVLYKYGCKVHRKMMDYIEADYELELYGCAEGSLIDEPVQLTLF